MRLIECKSLKKCLKKIKKLPKGAKAWVLLPSKKDYKGWKKAIGQYEAVCDVQKLKDLSKPSILVDWYEAPRNEAQTYGILRQYRDIVDQAMLVSKTNKEGIITYVNESFCHISGYRAEELIGRPHNIVRHPDTPSTVFDTMWKRLLAKKPWSGIIKNRRKDGGFYYVDAYIAPILDEEGDIIEMFALRKDVTSQILSAQHLQNREKELQSILDNLDAIALFVSKDEGLLLINTRFFDYFDYQDIEDFKRQHECICDLFIEEEGFVHAKARSDWLEFVTNNPHERHKVKMRDKRQKVRTFLLKATHIQATHRYVLTLQDVTPLEEALIEAKLNEHTKSMFVATMSHEIRTPLNGILGFTELLLKRTKDTKTKHYLQIIHQSGQTLLGIVNDILDFSKLESGKMALSITTVDLFSQMESVVSLFAARAKEKHLRYNVYIDPMIPKLLQCDIQRLKQVMGNLIGNAIKFTPDGGEVSVKIALLAHQEKIVQLRFSVHDTGIGIAKEQIGKIFDLFSQADNSVSRRYGGTGLGLSISAKFVEMMGSKIQVASSPGKGSTFWFDLTLPIKDTNASLVPIGNTIQEGVIALWVRDQCDALAITLRTYLEAWGFGYRMMNGIEAIEHECILFSCHTLLSKDDWEAFLARYSDMTVIFFPSNDMVQWHHPRIVWLEEPLIGSNLFNLLNTHLKQIEAPKITRSIESVAYFAGNVLVAEDNELNQILIDELLQERGIHALFAHDGIEALTLAQKESFDLILMDVNMPNMDGLRATKQLRNQGYQGPIVALTANVMVEDRQKYLQEGMDDYLAKPIETEALDAVLKKYLAPKAKPGTKEPTPCAMEKNRIDPDALQKVLGLQDQKVVVSLYRQFAQSAAELLVKLEALQKDHPPAWHQWLHQIKGIAGNMRFESLYALSAELDAKAQEGEWGQEEKEGLSCLVAMLIDLQSRIEERYGH